MADEAPISGKDFMKFMNNFKLTLKNTVKAIEENINVKLEAKLVKIDDGIANLNDKVDGNEKKTNELGKFLEGRLMRLEQDMKHSKMRSDTLGVSPKRNDDKDTIDEEAEEAPIITRKNLWSDEVEENLKNKDKLDGHESQDKEQWMEKKRTPPNWTDGLQAKVRQQKVKENSEKEQIIKIKSPTKSVKQKEGSARMETRKKDSERKEMKDAEVKTKEKENVKCAVKHWFSYDTDDSEDSSGDETDDNTNWTVEKKKMKEKKTKKQEEKTKGRSCYESTNYHWSGPYQR